MRMPRAAMKYYFAAMPAAPRAGLSRSKHDAREKADTSLRHAEQPTLFSSDIAASISSLALEERAINGEQVDFNITKIIWAYELWGNISRVPCLF